MLILDELSLVSADAYSCRIRLNGRPVACVVRVNRYEGEFMALNFEGMPPDAMVGLSDSDDYRPVLKALFSAIRGEVLRIAHDVRRRCTGLTGRLERFTPPQPD